MKNTAPEKSNLSLRLKGYAASAGALAAIALPADAQIAYSGAKNIELSGNEFYFVRMDDDMQADFAFFVGGSATSYTSGSAVIRYSFLYGVVVNANTSYANSWLARNTYINSDNGSEYIPVAFQPGDMINSTQTSWGYVNSPGWNAALAVSTSYYLKTAGGTISNDLEAGNFNENEGYLGVRFHIDGDMHYGWIRVINEGAGSNLKIFDWAYNTNVDEGLMAGLLVPQFSHEDFYSNLQVEIDLSFEYPVSNLSLSDFVVENGSVTGLTEVTAGTGFSVEITAESEGIVKITLPGESVTNNEIAIGDGQTQFAVHNILSTEDLAALGIRVYPNPVKENLNISLNGNARIEILTLDGRQIMISVIDGFGQVPVSRLKNGVYLLRIHPAGESPVTMRFLKN